MKIILCYTTLISKHVKYKSIGQGAIIVADIMAWENTGNGGANVPYINIKTFSSSAINSSEVDTFSVISGFWLSG